MKIQLLFFTIAVCMFATPAMANLFNFHFGSTDSSFDGTSKFAMSTNPTLTSGSVSRSIFPEAVAAFLAGQWALGGNFGLGMTITNITSTSAVGSGTFAVIDTTGDYISGNLSGTWRRVGGQNVFDGLLSNVSIVDKSGDGMFYGHSGSFSMNFPQPPSQGSIKLWSTTSIWLDGGAYSTTSSGVDAGVVPVPVPAALVLGVLGMGVAGLKLRKFA